MGEPVCNQDSPVAGQLWKRAALTIVKLLLDEIYIGYVGYSRVSKSDSVGHSCQGPRYGTFLPQDYRYRSRTVPTSKNTHAPQERLSVNFAFRCRRLSCCHRVSSRNTKYATLSSGDVAECQFHYYSGYHMPRWVRRTIERAIMMIFGSSHGDGNRCERYDAFIRRANGVGYRHVE